MSNRPRRRLLREWRMLALVLNDAAPPNPDSIQSLEEWNRLHRDAFRYLWREPLRFPNNIRPDAGLIDMQARNQPEFFNPLAGDPIPERPEHHREHGRLNGLWDKTEAAIYGALDYLEPARTITRPRFAPWFGEVQTIEDYPARFYCGFRKLRTGMTAVHQYGDSGNPWFRDHGRAVRNILNLDEWRTKSWPHRPIKQITEPELYALLVLAACWWALRDLRRLPKSWSRDDLDYSARKVQYAERWLAEAYRLNESHEKQAAIRTEEDAKRAAIQEKADREKAFIQAKADLEMAAIQAKADAEMAAIRAGWSKGGKTPKGSEGVRLLALALREEKPNASKDALFRVAQSRCSAPYAVGEYIITATAEDNLISAGPDGRQDGARPVSLSGWRKIVPPKQTKKS